MISEEQVMRMFEADTAGEVWTKEGGSWIQQATGRGRQPHYTLLGNNCSYRRSNII